jgi:hypothetical protein
MEENSNPVYSQNAIEFVAVANEFCKFVEGAGELSLSNFVEISHKILPLLYLKGTMLPEISESFEEFNEKFVTEDGYTFIQQILLDKFGPYNDFDEIYDPLRQENDEPVRLSMAEHFADIYQDIKDFIMQYRDGTNEIMANALWECKQAFEQYWGQRIVNVQRVLHHLKYTVVDLDSGAENNDINQPGDPDYDNIDTSSWPISRMQEGYEDEE